MALAHALRRVAAVGLITTLGMTAATAGDDPAVTPVTAKVKAADPPLNGNDLFPKMLAEAKTAYAKTRDYAGHMVRQERVGDKLLPEQTAEIRVRVEPFAVATKTLSPKPLLGQELAYVSGNKDDRVRVKAAGLAGSNGFVGVAADDAKANVDSRHPVTDTGVGAILARMEGVVAAEKAARNPAPIAAAECTFADRKCVRFEVECGRAHPTRYAYRAVLVVDKETKLPVRFEAYDAPKAGETTGELIECVSFVNLKWNTGLGDAAFEK